MVTQLTQQFVPSYAPISMVARTAAEAATIVAELDRQTKTRHDLVVPARQFQLTPGETENGTPAMALDLEGFGGSITRLGMNPTAHAQTAAKLDIPKVYYDRMLAQKPELLAENVNTWTKGRDGNWLIRTLGGVARANLSDRYRVLDSFDLFFNTYDAATKAGGQITRAALTDNRFEMRFVRPGWEREIQYRKDQGLANKGGRGTSVFIPGAYVSNSETGNGGLNIKPFILDLVCTNGMVGEQAFSRVHLGSQQDAGYLSDDTRKAKDAVLWAEVRDLVTAVFDRDRFNALIDGLEGTMAMELAAPIEAVDTVVKDFGFSDDDRQAILNELISPSFDRDPGRTVYGLISAITERAKTYEADAPERATDFEEAAMVLVRTAGTRQGVAIR